jgi:hypothetical protein
MSRNPQREGLNLLKVIVPFLLAQSSLFMFQTLPGFTQTYHFWDQSMLDWEGIGIGIPFKSIMFLFQKLPGFIENIIFGIKRA